VLAAAPDQFEPSGDPLRFRQALGRYATGVVVVTTATASGPVGLTVNSFASVSLLPPLILWSPAKSSGRHNTFIHARQFAVHVLAGGQKSVCDHFVRSSGGFGDFCAAFSDTGIPLLPGCAAIFVCTRTAVHDGGDHSIILGEVNRVHSGEASALVFRSGQFERAG
jgi:flavin reductase (DIM6/NTAB) family NADH-FMN oxidoreductase RutF